MSNPSKVLVMGLTKHRLGNLLELSEEKNTSGRYKMDSLKGISIKKVFIETKADMEGVSLRPYLLVRPGDFAYVTVTSRNGERITLAHNTSSETYIVSSSYVVFRVKRSDVLDSDYLFMYFNRSEFDRYARFNSWGSAREMFAWEDLCDIEIVLPPLPVQKKYVAVYKAMLANQFAYEKGLADLKLACDAYVEELKRKNKSQQINQSISLVEERNRGQYGLDALRGISIKKEFIPTKADMEGVPLSSYWIVRPGQFAYVPTTSRNGGKITLALNQSDETYIVSSSYVCFTTNQKKLLPAYLMAFFSRSEFDRYARFNSWGSARETFNWEDMCEVKIPLVDLETQQTVADMFVAYRLRVELNEKLKAQVQQACPILIKGSLDESRKARSRRKEVLS